tara:strand:- start:899 stop:1492 length:594 start_codon:yes stop_codon:yes gene_type:complete
MSKEQNMSIWDAVCKTDPASTKAANVRGNKITAIAPQTQIKAATEMFGPYGLLWGFQDIKLDFSMLEKTGIVVFQGEFFYSPADLKRDSFPIISSISAYKDGAMTKPDADFAKKVETDALTKALSKLGFNADVFMGCYDDLKYVAEMEAEFAASKPLSEETIKLIGQWVAAINAGNDNINRITDPAIKSAVAAELMK